MKQKDKLKAVLEEYAKPENWIHCDIKDSVDTCFVPAWRCHENGWELAREVLDECQ